MSLAPTTPASAQGGWFAQARYCLSLTDPAAKCAAVAAFLRDFEAGSLRRDDAEPVAPIGVPGRPRRPELVDPARVPRRRLGSLAGRAAMAHAVAHIEFNAINLALDAFYRFRGLPDDFYRDWLSVAADEARHFALMEQRLAGMGYAYGDFPAHDGLWEMAVQTAASCLQRMALVPRVLEARGLDVTPGMMQRLTEAGDAGTVACLEVILAEEVRHVAIGTRWFHHCCALEGLEPERTFLDLVAHHYRGTLRGPFNLEARYRAGFTEREMAALTEG